MQNTKPANANIEVADSVANKIITGNLSNFSNDNNANQAAINLREVLLVLSRHSSVLTGIMIFSLFMAAMFLILSTSLYTAESVLQINAQKTKVVNIESVISGMTPDESQVQSQLDVIRSRSLAGKVVDLLNLTNDPEFSPQVSTSSLKRWFMKLINKEEVVDKDSDEQKLIRAITISNVLKKLNVNRNPRSYTLIVSFTSKSPQKAALITNKFVGEYFEGQLAVKFDATKRANNWLTQKLGELQGKVRESELLVQAFREKSGLIETSGRTITDQQLSELNSQLILARTERAQAVARFNGMGDDDASADVLNSPLIQNLRNQEAQVMRKRSDLSSQYGPKHPKMINVNSELADLRDKIDIEIIKIKASLENEVNIATAREDALKKGLDELQDKSGMSTKAKIELDELTRQRDANKSLYESFLARSKETSEGQGLERPDAFVISEAEAPLAASYPNKPMVLLLALFLGACLGALVVLLLEHLDNTMNSSKQAEEVAGISAIGMVPELERGMNTTNYLLKRPSSAFSESLRSILTAVHFSNPDKMPKVIMVTSSVPKEGKSSFALAFAALVASSGKKVLLIDADMKRPAIARSLKAEFEFGLSDVLMGAATEKQVIIRSEKTGFDFVPSHPNISNSHNIIGSKQMQEFLDSMRRQYDMVIVDTNPVMAVSDCLVLSQLVDTTLFLVRWQKSTREIVKSAIKQLNTFNINIAGVILTRVDMERQSKYSYGERGNYYKNYSEYYSG